MARKPIPRWAILVTTVLSIVCLGAFLFIDNKVVTAVLGFVFAIWVISCTTSTVRDANEREFSGSWPFIRKIQKQSSPDVVSGPREESIVKE